MMLIVDLTENRLSFYEFVMPIVDIVKKDYEIRHYSEIKPEDTDKYEKIILSGSPLGELEYSKHLEKFEWIKNFKKPLLGICAGMQTIALVFGSKLKKCLEIGIAEIDTVKENYLFDGKFQAYELHKYSVKLPENFEALAKSENCLQAIRHNENEIYGVLFHPEVRNKKIIEKFIS